MTMAAFKRPLLAVARCLTAPLQLTRTLSITPYKAAFAGGIHFANWPLPCLMLIQLQLWLALLFTVTIKDHQPCLPTSLLATLVGSPWKAQPAIDCFVSLVEKQFSLLAQESIVLRAESKAPSACHRDAWRRARGLLLLGTLPWQGAIVPGS